MNRQYVLDLLAVEIKRIREIDLSTWNLRTKLEEECPVCQKSEWLSKSLGRCSCSLCDSSAGLGRCNEFRHARNHFLIALDQFRSTLHSLADEVNSHVSSEHEKAQEKHVDEYAEGERTQ